YALEKPLRIEQVLIGMQIENWIQVQRRSLRVDRHVALGARRTRMQVLVAPSKMRVADKATALGNRVEIQTAAPQELPRATQPDHHVEVAGGAGEGTAAQPVEMASRQPDLLRDLGDRQGLPDVLFHDPTGISRGRWNKIVRHRHRG